VKWQPKVGKPEGRSDKDKARSKQASLKMKVEVAGNMVIRVVVKDIWVIASKREVRVCCFR
jgi:hypothetical protein